MRIAQNDHVTCEVTAESTSSMDVQATREFFTLLTICFISTAIKVTSGEETEGWGGGGGLLLLVSRLHANSSLSLTRVARVALVLLSCCMHGCLHECVTAACITARAALSLKSCRDSELWLPFLPCGVRERGSSAKKETWKINLEKPYSHWERGQRHFHRTPPMSR